MDFKRLYKKKWLKTYGLIGVAICLMLVVLKTYPELLYHNKIEIDNYTIYSNQPIDSSIFTIQDSTNLLMNKTPILDNAIHYKVFFTNNYPLFWLHTFLGKSPGGACNFINEHIYLANVDLSKNIVFNFTNGPKEKCRSIHSIVAHESTHILLREHLGLFKYLSLIKSDNWKVEGYCEWIGHHSKPIDKSRIVEIAATRSYLKNPYDQYLAYWALTCYLIDAKGYSFNQFIDTDKKFEEVLEEYVSYDPIN